jgi:transposase
MGTHEFSRKGPPTVSLPDEEGVKDILAGMVPGLLRIVNNLARLRPSKRERYRVAILRQPGLGATNWRAELAIRFGVILLKVWGGSRTWAGARAQSVLMSVWRACWQQGRSALDFLSQLLRGSPVALAMPP